MKCLVLAGGKGNSLWPLSREEYPKQFIRIKNNHSLFQETIARNIPFCDEFLIATTTDYYFIAEGQMKEFQGLKYRCILEEEGRKTCPVTALVCMKLNPSELVYVVSADQVIQGSNYKEAVMQGCALARDGKLVTFGMEVLFPYTGYGYIRNHQDDVLEFKEKPDAKLAQAYYKSGEYLWNSGNFLFCAGDFLNELKKTAPNVYTECKKIKQSFKMDRNISTLSLELMKAVEQSSLEKAVFEKSDCVSVVKASFHWWDIGNLDVLSAYVRDEKPQNTICENCENVRIINQTDRQLVVANNTKDIMVINTEDACYIAGPGSTSMIKPIMRKYPEYKSYFEKNRTVYRPWGKYEILNYTLNYKVKKVYVYPGKTLTTHRHLYRSEQWSVVQGEATVQLKDCTRALPLYSSILIPAGEYHTLSNHSEETLIVMEVSFGSQVIEEDTEKAGEAVIPRDSGENIIRLEPAFKDYLWGGTKLRDVYGKECDYQIIAESWELSAHEDGQSRVASGIHKGMLFQEYLHLIGEEALGWKCHAFEKFPLLIKFIDAKNQLSVQVHPDDDFALLNENEYGKNEMWYILDCEPDSFIYFGLKRDVSQEELRQRALNNTITEVLNKVMVKPGDTFFVKSGTIHAIGAGVLICEIQQNSNCTYRLYDYGRRDKYGNLRELHLDKAIHVAKTEKIDLENMHFSETSQNGYRQKKLCECKYFTSVLYKTDEHAEIQGNEASFLSIVVLKGKGKIGTESETLYFKPGDSFFIHAGKRKIEIQGVCECIVTSL